VHFRAGKCTGVSASTHRVGLPGVHSRAPLGGSGAGVEFGRVQGQRPDEERRGCIGVPGMIALLAVWAFAGTVGGLRGVLVAIIAVVLIYLIVGAIVSRGRRGGHV